MNFSIILNSRGRIPLLKQMLTQICVNTYDLNNLEVIVNYDTDDFESISALEYLHRDFIFLKSTIFKREHNIHTNVNKLANISIGKYIWPMGDDCHIVTKHWDLIASSKFEKYFEIHTDRIAIGAVESTSVDKNINTKLGWYCDAPIFSKECIAALGYLVNPHFISLGADVATYSIYKGANRIIDMREICFDHVTHNTIQKIVNPDKTAVEYRTRQSQSQSLNPFSLDYSTEIQKLKDKLNG